MLLLFFNMGKNIYEYYKLINSPVTYTVVPLRIKDDYVIREQLSRINGITGVTHLVENEYEVSFEKSSITGDNVLALQSFNFTILNEEIIQVENDMRINLINDIKHVFVVSVLLVVIIYVCLKR